MSSMAPDRGGGNSLAYVYDGQQCLGHVLARGKTGFEAFDRDDRSLGLFPNTASSANALLITEGHDLPQTKNAGPRRTGQISRN
jgi:hypothetical protein